MKENKRRENMKEVLKEKLLIVTRTTYSTSHSELSLPWVSPFDLFSILPRTSIFQVVTSLFPNNIYCNCTYINS